MTKIDMCDTQRNNLIAAALGLQQCTKTASAVIPLPGTKQYILVGDKAELTKLLAAEQPLNLPDPAPLALRTLGGLMSNVLYNLAQQPGEPLTGDDVAKMDQLRQQWDEAVRVDRQAALQAIAGFGQEQEAAEKCATPAGIDLDKQRALFEKEANAARFFPAEIEFTRTKSPSGRDEYANSHLQSRWEGWQAAMIAQARAAQDQQAAAQPASTMRTFINWFTQRNMEATGPWRAAVEDALCELEALAQAQPAAAAPGAAALVPIEILHRASFWDKEDAAVVRHAISTAAAPAGDAKDAARLPRAVSDLMTERTRQIAFKGFDPAHDDEHDGYQLAMAAAWYALPEFIRQVLDDKGLGLWPWAQEWWKPGDVRRNLVKAGALILAEIERRDRADATNKPEGA